MTNRRMLSSEDASRLDGRKADEHREILQAMLSEQVEMRAMRTAELRLTEEDLEKANSSIGHWYRIESRLRRQLETLMAWLGLLSRMPRRTSVTLIRQRIAAMKAEIKKTLEAKD